MEMNPAPNSSSSDDSDTSPHLTRSSASKRSNPTLKDLRSPKKSTPAVGRLWCDKDEIAILKGMLDYHDEKGKDAVTDSRAFYDFIKEELRLDAARTQVVDKIRGLRRKYENFLSKKKILTPHEQRLFDLSVQIWGRKDDVGSKKSNVKASTVTGDEAGAAAEENARIVSEDEAGAAEEKSWQFIGETSIAMGLDQNFIKVGLRLCSHYKKAELEEKWKELYVEESKLFLKKLDLVSQETKMIIEALKASGSTARGK